VTTKNADYNVALDPNACIHTPSERPKAIVATVAKTFEISSEDILGTSRLPHIVEARYVAALILQEQLGWRHARIGKWLNRNHSTIIVGLRSLRAKMVIDRELQQQVTSVRQALQAPHMNTAEKLMKA
jgi:chromosomal replication initiation ATPase DnaA